MASVVAIAPLMHPSIGLAQNQSDVTGSNMSDVTGPNLSDVTGPNLSDVTGPNQSDNTGLLGDPIIGNADEEGRLSDFFQEFFNEFGDELGIDPNVSLAEQLRQAKLACEDQSAIRRFAREPGANAELTPACAELGRLIELAQEALANQGNNQPAAVNRRIW
ncbi:hypothetical protein [Leptothoe spongobia]|uniref:hypothetical protein n=1 Tax=Leptothoe spongobia TaxID=2651728 RepID=UPI001C010663|nr:hypothetical protein [Leptothoe spongobia]